MTHGALARAAQQRQTHVAEASKQLPRIANAQGRDALISLASVDTIREKLWQPAGVLTFDIDFAWLGTRRFLLGSLDCVYS